MSQTQIPLFEGDRTWGKQAPGFSLEFGIPGKRGFLGWRGRGNPDCVPKNSGFLHPEGFGSPGMTETPKFQPWSQNSFRFFGIERGIPFFPSLPKFLIQGENSAPGGPGIIPGIGENEGIWAGILGPPNPNPIFLGGDRKQLPLPLPKIVVQGSSFPRIPNSKSWSAVLPMFSCPEE